MKGSSRSDRGTAVSDRPLHLGTESTNQLCIYARRCRWDEEPARQLPGLQSGARSASCRPAQPETASMRREQSESHRKKSKSWMAEAAELRGRGLTCWEGCSNFRKNSKQKHVPGG